MQTLDRSLYGIQDRVKVPFVGLSRVMPVGPGHVILTLGEPGAGKSAFGLWWMLHMDSPGLYLSLDADLQTQAARTVSMLSSIPYDRVTENVEQWSKFLRERDRQLPMMFDYPVKASEVDEVVQSFEEFYSQAPSLIVVDNLKNITGAATYEAFNDSVLEMIRVAKKHKTAVLLLHHTNRQSLGPPHLRSGKFAGEDDAPFVLGLSQGWDNFIGKTLNVSVLKNRFGQHDINVPLRFKYDTMQMEG